MAQSSGKASPIRGKLVHFPRQIKIRKAATTQRTAFRRTSFYPKYRRYSLTLTDSPSPS